MPSNRNRSQLIRLHARTHGISYTTAMRALEEKSKISSQLSPEDYFFDIHRLIATGAPAKNPVPGSDVPAGHSQWTLKRTIQPVADKLLLRCSVEPSDMESDESLQHVLREIPDSIPHFIEAVRTNPLDDPDVDFPSFSEPIDLPEVETETSDGIEYLAWVMCRDHPQKLTHGFAHWLPAVFSGICSSVEGPTAEGKFFVSTLIPQNFFRTPYATVHAEAQQWMKQRGGVPLDRVGVDVDGLDRLASSVHPGWERLTKSLFS